MGYGKGKGYWHKGKSKGKKGSGKSGKGRQEWMTEIKATHNGQWHNNAEKVKLILDYPLGSALEWGDGDVLVGPTEAIQRLKQVIPFLPLHAPENEWQQFGTQLYQEAQQRGYKLGKSIEELWSDIGYEVHKHETIDDKIEKGFERMANTMANTMASAMTNAMTENNKFLKEHFANNQVTTPSR